MTVKGPYGRRRPVQGGYRRGNTNNRPQHRQAATPLERAINDPKTPAQKVLARVWMAEMEAITRRLRPLEPADSPQPGRVCGIREVKAHIACPT
jgi:hypothetical protein